MKARATLAGLAALTAVSAVGCMAPKLAQREQSAYNAITALQQGQFEAAAAHAAENVRRDGANPYGRLIRAITRYKAAMHQAALDGRTLVAGAEMGSLNHRYLQSSLEQLGTELSAVDEDLIAAGQHEDLALELCLACWEVDWNGNGRVDSRDRRLLEVELDQQGKAYPAGDPRRTPVFRFDHGDIAWARAFVTFQRALLQLVLAFDFSEAARTLLGSDDLPETVVIRLLHPEKVAQAKRLLLAALALSDQARRAYLVEKDDDREWVPNPRQQSHPLPLPVDETLYETWQGVLGDLEQLIRGREGLSVAEVLELAELDPEQPPTGYVDLGRMLSEPKDIVISLKDLKSLSRSRRGLDVDQGLKIILGDYYVANLKKSPLTGRLIRMKKEIDVGEETLGRKLRYLLWLN